MHFPPRTFLASALCFLQAATVAHSQEALPVSVSKIAFSEVRTDSLQRIVAPGEPVTFVVRDDTETTIVVKFPLTDFDSSLVDELTFVGINIGGFSHEAVLSEAVNWSDGKARAKFVILSDTASFDDEGEPIQERIGTVVYAWTERKLTVTVTGHGLGSIVADLAEDFFDETEGAKVRFLEPIEADVSFGEQSGSAVLYARGVVRKVTRLKGTGDDAESFDLYKLHAVSYHDTIAPEVTLTDPGEGADVDSEFLTLTGVAQDNLESPSSLRLAKVLLNGVEVTDQISAEFSDGDDTGEPPLSPEFVVDDIPLVLGPNTIEIFVSDSTGNTTVATRHVVFTGAAGS